MRHERLLLSLRAQQESSTAKCDGFVANSIAVLFSCSAVGFPQYGQLHFAAARCQESW
jgi:hypothetical protein